MKSGKHKKQKYSKQTKLTCPNCEMIFYAVTHYKDHMKTSKKCHSVNLYCCKFCDYVGFDSNGLNQHLMKNQLCTYHYEELKVTTGLLPNIGKQIRIDGNMKNITSYTCQRFSADGIEDEVQLNLHDETVEKQQYIKAKTSVNSQKMDHLTATYQLKRLIACMENNNLHSDNTHEMFSNHNDSDSE